MAKKKTSRQRTAQNSVKNGARNSANTRSNDSNLKNGAGGEQLDEISAKCNAPVINLAISPVECLPKGLVNLGNTCFFNSVVQNLCRTPGLLYAMQQSAKEVKLQVEGEDVPTIRCELPSIFNLSQAFLNFLITMGENSMNLSNTVGRQKVRTRTESPKVLFNQLCSVSPRFRGYQQQDSQELFQALLDGMKVEEVKRRKRAILTKLGLLRMKASDVNNELKAQVKSYGEIVTKIPTVVDLIFGGKLVSSVLCDECGQITQVIEDFVDISLPIVEVVPSHQIGGSGQKGRKEPTASEKNVMAKNSTNSVKTGDSQMTSQSKHAKKKKREQGRRKNRRNQTKSQSFDCEQEDHAEQQDQDNNKDWENRDSVEDAGGERADNTRESITNCDACQENGTDGKFETEKCQDREEDFQNAANENQMNDITKTKSSDEKNTSNQVTICVPVGNGTVGDASQAIGGSINNGEAPTRADLEVKELASQLGGLAITEYCKGTDFSMNGKGGDVDFQMERDQNEDTTMKIEENAENVVQTVLANATRELQQHSTVENDQKSNSDMDTTSENSTEHNLEMTNSKKNCLLGGKVPSEMEYNAAETSRVNIRRADASMSSGNDEKSDDEICQPLEAQSGPSLFETPVKCAEVKFTSFCSKLPKSLSPRYEPEKQECSIQSCLHKFTMAEMLTGNNQFGCDECTKHKSEGGTKPKTIYCNASKQLLIKKPPNILTLQLKRFQQTGRSLRKFSKRVEIPLELDLSPYCTDDCRDCADDNGKILYALYGVVEHSGSLSRGHYTAYIAARPESPNLLQRLGKEVEVQTSDDVDNNQSQWYHISDTAVSKCTTERALNCNAYLLFYERLF